MKVLINGVGNIGTTLACLLIDFKEILNISEVFVYKNIKQNWKLNDLHFLEQKGITIVFSDKVSLETMVQKVDYVFDTTANGFGLKNKSIYESAINLKGACSQGSEKNFGIPFMSNLNNEQIEFQKFVQIVSCNTHGAAVIINSLSDKNLSNLEFADFVVVRRSEDIGNHERLVGANVVARHLSDLNGTHHAIDVKDMYATIGIDCPITSSDITTPSQLLHSTRFHLKFKTTINPEIVLHKFEQNPFIASTNKFDSNQIFELGRRYGKYGRIYNHGILVENNLLYTENSVKGWAFIPQEGNSIISTIHAFLLQVYGVDFANNRIEKIKKQLLFSKL